MTTGGRPLVGVIGGVGPLATVYFMDKVVRLTEAACDQEHVDMIVFNHATIPDRTDFILGRSDADPGPVMASDGQRLEAFGAGLLVLPCNTAHNFTDPLLHAVSVPVLSIIDVTVDEAIARIPDLTAVGIMATSGTAHSGVYQRALAQRGISTILPDDEDQATLMRIIYEQVKAGADVDLAALHAVGDNLRAAGAQVLVLGCTELSVVAEDADLLSDPNYVDSLDVLARRTIESSGHQIRN